MVCCDLFCVIVTNRENNGPLGTARVHTCSKADAANAAATHERLIVVKQIRSETSFRVAV